jgi:CBS-domain-containing membrane protein
MNKLVDVKVLKIFMGEAATHKGRPLHEMIVKEARQRGMAGASVSRGFMGFGANSLLHTSKILRLAEDLPVMVEIVDVPDRIAAFLPVVDGMVEEGGIVVTDAQAIFHLPLRIRDVMTKDVATVEPHTPLVSVVKLLLSREVKAVPVMDGKKIVGIITGGDLLARGGMPLSLDMQCALPSAMREEHVHCLDFKELRASDVMSPSVQTLNIKTTVPDALRLMAKGNMKRLPVVADDGSLMGIVSRADVLGAMGHVSSVAAHLDVLPEGMHGSAREIMHRNVPTAALNTPLSAILEQIVAFPLRRVVIVDEAGKILGIVHDRDLLNHFARKNAPGIFASLIGILSHSEPQFREIEGTAGDVMATKIITVPPEMPLSEVIQTLVAHKIKRVVVADENGRLLGLVDRDTVLKGLAEE